MDDEFLSIMAMIRGTTPPKPLPKNVLRRRDAGLEPRHAEAVKRRQLEQVDHIARTIQRNHATANREAPGYAKKTVNLKKLRRVVRKELAKQ